MRHGDTEFPEKISNRGKPDNRHPATMVHPTTFPICCSVAPLLRCSVAPCFQQDLCGFAPVRAFREVRGTLFIPAQHTPTRHTARIETFLPKIAKEILHRLQSDIPYESNPAYRTIGSMLLPRSRSAVVGDSFKVSGRRAMWKNCHILTKLLNIIDTGTFRSGKRDG